MKRTTMLALLAAGLAVPAFAQTGFTIAGGLSNFDITNRCDDETDECEVEIEDIRPEHVVHTYRNWNYGSPTITLSPSGTSTIIDYRSPQHLTARGAIEHFGISLRQLGPTNTIRVRWMRGGRPALVNGQVPNPGGGTSPATQPVMPSIIADMGTGSGGGDGVTLTVVNNDTSQGIWVKRRAQVSTGMVSLESLMRNDPVVTTSVVLDAAPFYMAPGDTVTATSDLVEIEDNQSAVFAAQYFQDLAGGPFNPTHTRGPEMGNVMTASIASPGGTCDYYRPFIQEQPVGLSLDEGFTANIRVRAEGNDLDLTYQWMREGVDLIDSPNYRGVDTDELSVEEVTTANEGLYACRISNACGEVITDSALLFVAGHNEPPPRPEACSPDTNDDGNVDQDDVSYLINVIGGGPNDTGIDPDFNKDGNVDQDDVMSLIDVVAGGDCP